MFSAPSSWLITLDSGGWHVCLFCVEVFSSAAQLKGKHSIVGLISVKIGQKTRKSVASRQMQLSLRGYLVENELIYSNSSS